MPDNPHIQDPEIANEALVTLAEMVRIETGGTIDDFTYGEIRRLLTTVAEARKAGGNEQTALRSAAAHLVFERFAYNENGQRVLGTTRDRLHQSEAADRERQAALERRALALEAQEHDLMEREVQVGHAERTQSANRDLDRGGGSDADLTYEPVQLYETTVIDNETHRSIFFCTVPARSIPERRTIPVGSQGERELSHKDFLISELDLVDLFPIEAEQIQLALATLLSGAPDLYRPIWDTSWLASKEVALRTLLADPSNPIVRRSAEFARYLVEANVVPFESSPLAGVSLADLMKASGVGIGAYIGFVVSGSSPLLFITVPAGMVICGMASGLAHGMEEGLRSLIKRLLSERRSPRRKAAHPA